MFRRIRPPVYRGRLANVSEAGRSRCPEPRKIGASGGTPGRALPLPVPPLADPKNDERLVSGVTVRKALNVYVRTLGSRAERAAARFSPAATASARCDCNWALTRKAMSQA